MLKKKQRKMEASKKASQKTAEIEPSITKNRKEKGKAKKDDKKKSMHHQADSKKEEEEDKTAQGNGNSEIGRKRKRDTPYVAGKPFKRVKEEHVDYEDDRLRDNTFHSKRDSYGSKSYEDLRVTRGKGFRKQKTKKKRQQTHGGKIDNINAVNSYRFQYSDDDE